MVEPEAALLMAFLKVSFPGSTIISSALITGATISGFQPGPALNFKALGTSVASKLKAPTLKVVLTEPLISSSGLLALFDATNKSELFTVGIGTF